MTNVRSALVAAGVNVISDNDASNLAWQSRYWYDGAEDTIKAAAQSLSKHHKTSMFVVEGTEMSLGGVPIWSATEYLPAKLEVVALPDLLP